MNQTENINKSNSKEAQQHSEGSVALAIEEQTAKIPSDVFLWAAVGSIGTSLILHITGKKDDARQKNHRSQSQE